MSSTEFFFKWDLTITIIGFLWGFDYQRSGDTMGGEGGWFKLAVFHTTFRMDFELFGDGNLYVAR